MNAKRPMELPPLKYLKECFIYNPENGVILWKTRPLHHFKNAHGMNTFNSRYAGDVCGSPINGRYLGIHLCGRTFLLHRIIWKLVTGDEPPSYIDHKDTNKMNNKWLNLREATKSENAFNTGITRRNNTGYKGVSYDSNRNKFYACISLNGKSKSLGRYDTAEQAHQAYVIAAKDYHGEFMRTK